MNHFHDHLKNAAGIGFGRGLRAPWRAATRCYGQVDDGASTRAVFPNCGHMNNAGHDRAARRLRPALEIYLWTSAGCGSLASVRDVNGADDAYIVYHEYTHGMTFRLVTDASTGIGALLGTQSGAIGEGLERLVRDGLPRRVRRPPPTVRPPVSSGPRPTWATPTLRTEPFDCPVGPASAGRAGTLGAGPGGYTYGDFARVVGGDEVHADGEIWAQTLWDLPAALIAAHPADGVTRARALVTDGLRLSPESPTFLDLRDAILAADVGRGYGDRDLVWRVFAARGMGLNASTDGRHGHRPGGRIHRSAPAPLPPPGSTLAAPRPVAPAWPLRSHEPVVPRRARERRIGGPLGWPWAPAFASGSNGPAPIVLVDRARAARAEGGRPLPGGRHARFAAGALPPLVPPGGSGSARPAPAGPRGCAFSGSASAAAPSPRALPRALTATRRRGQPLAGGVHAVHRVRPRRSRGA